MLSEEALIAEVKSKQSHNIVCIYLHFIFIAQSQRR